MAKDTPATTQSESEKPLDQTVPGGRYLINGVPYDAHGNRLEVSEETGKEQPQAGRKPLDSNAQ